LIFELIDEIVEKYPQTREKMERLSPEIGVSEEITLENQETINIELQELLQQQTDIKTPVKVETNESIVVDLTKLSKEDLLFYYCQEGIVDEFVALIKDVLSWQSIKDPQGSSLLHVSVQKPSKITEFLIDSGFPLDIEDKAARTPLFIACSMGNKEGCLHLLGNKASANWKDMSGASPLSVCLRRHFFDIANELVLFGADVNYKKPNGSTYTHESIILQDREMFDWLLDHEVKLNIKDYLGEAPLLKSLVCKDSYFFSSLLTIKTVDVGVLTKTNKNIIQHLVNP
jgi:ankyrin repeat protein